MGKRQGNDRGRTDAEATDDDREGRLTLKPTSLVWQEIGVMSKEKAVIENSGVITGYRFGARNLRRNTSTRCRVWMKARVSMCTIPRSGLLADSRLSSTSDSAYNESPAYSGASNVTRS